MKPLWFGAVKTNREIFNAGLARIHPESVAYQWKVLKIYPLQN
jgi:hypothetical protein